MKDSEEARMRGTTAEKDWRSTNEWMMENRRSTRNV